MRVTDVDWRAMFRGWCREGNREDVIYIRSICDESWLLKSHYAE